METIERTPAEIETELEKATPEELQVAQKRAYEEWLRVAQTRDTTTELRFALTEVLKGAKTEEPSVTAEEGERAPPTPLDKIVTQVFLAAKVRELTELDEPTETSAHSIIKRVRGEAEQTLVA